MVAIVSTETSTLCLWNPYVCLEKGLLRNCIILLTYFSFLVSVGFMCFCSIVALTGAWIFSTFWNWNPKSFDFWFDWDHVVCRQHQNLPILVFDCFCWYLLRWLNTWPESWEVTVHTQGQMQSFQSYWADHVTHRSRARNTSSTDSDRIWLHTENLTLTLTILTSKYVSGFRWAHDGLSLPWPTVRLQAAPSLPEQRQPNVCEIQKWPLRYWHGIPRSVPRWWACVFVELPPFWNDSRASDCGICHTCLFTRVLKGLRFSI